MHRKPNDEKDAIFDCNLFGFNNKIVHTKKRQLKDFLHQKLAGYLVDAKKEACVWRVEKAQRIMKFGDPNPPILYSPQV